MFKLSKNQINLLWAIYQATCCKFENGEEFFVAISELKPFPWKYSSTPYSLEDHGLVVLRHRKIDYKIEGCITNKGIEFIKKLEIDWPGISVIGATKDNQFFHRGCAAENC